MTNVDMLRDVVKRAGISKSYIAERLGISNEMYLRKENGKYQFMAGEIIKLKAILCLSESQVIDLFLQ